MKRPEPASTQLVKAFGSHAIRRRILLAIAIFSVPALGAVQPLASNIMSSAYGEHYDSATHISDKSVRNNGTDDKGDGRYNPIADPSYYSNLTQYSYLLYYGQFDSSVTSSILSVKPTLLVTNYYAMDEDTRERFAEKNVTVIAYLPISWTQKDIDSTLDEAQQVLADGADGIFVDEAATMSNDWELWYHGQIYQSVKEYGEDKIVIINPGTTSIGEDSMLVADIICFEHEWRNFEGVEWALDYPGWRFMGISSNEFPQVMGYDVDEESARQDLKEARHMNIAYHYSADHYISLPPWLDVYGGIAGSPHPVSDYSQELDLESLEQAKSAPDSPAVTESEEDENKHDSAINEEEPEEEDESGNQPTASDQDEEESSSTGEEAEDEEGEDADNEQQEEKESPEDPEDGNEEPGVQGDDDANYAGDPTDKESEEGGDLEPWNANSTSQNNSTVDSNFIDEESADATSTSSDSEAEGDDQLLSKDEENDTDTG